MYRYKFVEATIGGVFSEPSYRQIIDEHAKDGWKLVQVLPINYNGHGKPKSYEVILEQVVNEDAEE
ncbi:DUF4177 domain-containing protein [Pontibacillus yanchengensis]|uniref:DUF4177 domain-containing protein n=1 Tax=Pontibacillus yanchengensis Y32 TaxID=1385514 RepID=A0A0A2TBY6_9BACI|nr:DUF4177 domain-containing protein [Pontibacillus yanchengensis]KGP71606.1 hypothetical protein N782_17905 [Pontibacillus yanchengensis Y32]